MSAPKTEGVTSLQIPASVVRRVAQLPPAEGDFRSRFPLCQPHILSHISAMMVPGASTAAVQLTERVAAGMWAMYEETIDSGELPQVRRAAIESIQPPADSLIERLVQRHGGGRFDPEWLISLPRGPQPHVVGFVVGALRASRLHLQSEDILKASRVLLAVAGALEGVYASEIDRGERGL